MSAGINGKKLGVGLAMLVVFAGVLVAVFSPLFDGKNGLEYLDNLYNSVSKDSAYYIADLKQQNEEFSGRSVKLKLTLSNAAEARRAASILSRSGAHAIAAGGKVTAEGDLGEILANGLDDADKLFHNQSDALTERHGIEGRLVEYTWWKIAIEAVKDLNRQRKFKEARFVDTVKAKGIECAYNYYGIEPQKIGERWGAVVLSLVFYVLYTVWFGFAVLFLFEGAGFQLGH